MIHTFTTYQDAETAVLNSGVLEWEWSNGMTWQGFAEWLWRNHSEWDTDDITPIREYILANGGDPADYNL